MNSLPSDFSSRLAQICPPDRLAAVLTSFAQPKVTSFRINQLQITPDQALAALSEAGLIYSPLDWAQASGIAAHYCAAEQRDLLTHHPLAASGQIYVQSLSSMLAPLALQPNSADWVLDLAAAPGGKTILMAEMMRNQGKISAVEQVTARFHRLRANLDRCGVLNTQTYLKDGRAVGSLKPDTFDRVMLDAPCSSESRFRLDQPDSMAHWSLRKVAETAHKQKRLILSAFDALKPGGTLLYCTCAFSPEENELIVTELLKKRPAQLVPVALPERLPSSVTTAGLTTWGKKKLPDALALTRRVWPDAHFDGFYLAQIKKPI